ncbi:MAG: adenylyl cyclase CyaB, putative [halophilic archaeon J07HX5]|nr:MAG: adenylyl cyclase CyaB, putative [halophilic archaeon J07HX5]
MYEVELKLQTAHEPVRDQLGTTDATHVGRITQADTYYQAPDRDFADTDEALRIRIETPGDTAPESLSARTSDARVLLTYKGPLIDPESKSRAEAETPVADATALERILTGLGYEPTATVHKRRDRYRVEECAVVLDRVEGLGEYVEVETETDADVETARERAVAVLEQLGLDPADQIRTSYLGQLLAARDGS